MSLFQALSGFTFSSLAPQRSFADAARMTFDSASRPSSLLQGVAISAIAGSVEMASTAVQYGHLMAGLARERLAVSALREALPDHPLPFATHPLLLRTHLGLQKNKDGVMKILADNLTDIQPYLQRPLEDLLDRFGMKMDPSVMVRRSAADEAFFESHPLAMFDGINSRGIVQYDRELFGRDVLQTLTGELRPEQTRLWKILKDLPQGAVVADWGGGAGVFGYELRRLRPDITVYVVDRHDPADALHQSTGFSRDPRQPEPRDVLSSIRPLVGDGETMTLPEGQKADLVISVHLSPYVNDALGLVAHLHNQLKPGGILITTLAGHVFDASATWLQWHKVHKEMARDFSGFGIESAVASEGRSHLLRRSDRRRLVRSARHAESFTHVDYFPMMGRRNSRLSLYEAADRPIGRWMRLVDEASFEPDN